MNRKLTEEEAKAFELAGDLIKNYARHMTKNNDEYDDGYYDGLLMAVDILDNATVEAAEE